MRDGDGNVRVLVVDDDDLVRETLRNYLATSGFDVLVASDGEEALALLTHEAVDLVLTDLIMPNREGIETIVELRRQESPPKIIAISGGGRSADADFLHMATMLGADDTLRKPFSRGDLIAKINDVLGISC